MEPAPTFCKTYAPGDDTSFWRYPSHKVLAIFDEPENVSRAVAALRESGYDDDALEIFCGEQGEQQIDFSGKTHGLWAAFVRSLQAFSAEHLYLDYYQNELHSGHFLLQVAVKDRDQKFAAAQTLHEAGGKRITYYGNWLIEEIANKAEHTEIGGYGISRTVNLSYHEAVARVKETLKDEGFGVLTEIDLKAKFKEKLDQDFDNYVILGACNPGFAYEALGKDMELGLLLPCNVVVYEQNGKTVVAAIDPVKMMSVAGNADLDRIAGEVENRLRRAIDNI
jgi:uncharacterized protein (DUF302 family)